ncbi:MAG: CCA tRNA nucleotidyltransferase [Acidimicrobiales bacterium]
MSDPAPGADAPQPTTRLDQTAVSRVLEMARPVAERLTDAGHRAYVVGGLVRDLHLGGQPPHDIDITTDAQPADIKAAVAPIADDVWSQGERFGTIGCRLDGIDFEITTHRSEAYDPSSRKPAVTFSTAISSDLSRRDFTVNAMAIDVVTGLLVDPFNGAADLERRVLRTPVDARISFSDDPLRVLRAARFMARLGLVPDPGLETAATDLAHRLSIVSSERVRDEFEKLLAAERPGVGIGFLARVGALDRLFEGVDHEGLDVAVLADSIDAVPAAFGADRVLARRCVFFGRGVGFGDAEAIVECLRRLRYSRSDQRRTASLGLATAIWVSASRPRDAEARRVVAQAGDDWPSAAACVAAVADDQSAKSLVDAVERLARREDLTRLGPELSGAQVMKLLGLPGGPEVGAVLDELRRWRLDEGEHEVAELERRVLAWFEAAETDL